MKIKFIVVAAFLLLFVLPAPAMSANAGDTYISGFFGSNTVTDSNLKDTNPDDEWLRRGWELTFEPGLAVSGATGTYITPNVRYEFAVGLYYNNFEEIGAEFEGWGMFAGVATTMLNAFYEWDVEGWRPYVGGGFGLGIISLEEELQWEGNKVVPAVQFGMGLVTPLSDTLDLTFDYRLLITKDAPGDFGFDADYIAHTVGVGIRYNF